ncbi:MAG: S-layer homology domain-containing protein [Clostridia bacterium]|nr:S-layer homology domain-containing protein [Clostridia bacterium]
MKKFSICILILCLLVCEGCPILSSAAKEASVTAEMNYLTNSIDVVYNGVQSYDAYVAIYIAKSEAALTSFSDIVKVDKALCKSKSTVTFHFECDESMTTGTYNVYAVLSGSQTAASAVSSIPVVSMGERGEMLSAINAAPGTSQEVNTAIADLIYARLGTNFKYAAPETWKNNYIFSIKQEDYQGNFDDFSEVDRAWYDADNLYAMRQSTDAEALSRLIDADGESLGLDITNADYTNYKMEFSAMFKSLIEASDVKSRTAAEREFQKTAAIIAINERDVEGKALALTEYKSELGLNELQERITSAGAVTVARLLDGFKSTDISSVYPKVLSAIEAVETSKNPADDDDDNKSSGGGGSSGGSGGRGHSYNGVSVPAGNMNINENNYVSQNQTDVKKFNDIANEHWAKEYIEELAKEGIINGYADGSFRADNVVLREELVKMIVKTFALSGEKELNFTDVEESFWAKEVINTAVACGIINGISDTEFGVGMPITRQDMAVIVDRTLSYLKCELDERETIFTDSDKISDYAASSVSKLAKAGLFNGFSDGSFMPHATLTRAQTAKILSQARVLVK